MKLGTCNINDYLNKLHEDVEENNIPYLNEEKAETETGKPDEGIIQQGGDNKAYDWLKKEFQKGKTEVKVEMSSHTFQPGYEFKDAPKSTKDFPGMYGEIKTQDSKGKMPEQAKFPETKFPGMETKSDNDNKNTKESSEDEKKEGKTMKVDVKTKSDKED